MKTLHHRLFSVLLAFTACSLDQIQTAVAADRPNVVWLVTEDTGSSWYRLYNPSQGAAMPNIERLASSGLMFRNAFSCAPVCSVARSTIISGCYAPRLGVQYHRAERLVQMPAGMHMFPWYLRQAGYYTTNNSKEDYNFVKAAKQGVWDESSRNASFRNRSEGQPFFHVQNYSVTHEGQLFRGLPKNAESVIDPDEIEVFPYHQDTPLMRRKYAEYLTRQTLVDKEIGNFVTQLEDEGLLDDTFIIHYGDHGGVLPGSKGYANNDGLQVAMVVYVPKNWQHLAPAERGAEIDGFVQFVDLSATVLNVCGVEPPPGIDGRPFLGKGVTLSELSTRDTAFGYADRFDEKYDFVRSLHHGQFQYMRRFQRFNVDGLQNNYRYKQPAFAEWRILYQQGKLNARQSQFFEIQPPECLYDLSADPHGVNNLAADPAHREILLQLRSKLQQQMRQLPDLSLLPEPVMLSQSADRSPAALGQEQQQRISTLLDVADLQLLPWDQAATPLARALKSNDELVRYWALISCSSFGMQAVEYADQAAALADSDPSRLVRLRAAEFLGLLKYRDPMPVLTELLQQTTDPIEADLILNSVVLLRDHPPGWPFDVQALQGTPWLSGKNGQFERRIGYLRGDQP
jgi:arylsulfatase A-like enzyme